MLSLPPKDSLHCFVYGFLKPHELAFPIVENYVHGYHADVIHAGLRILDGLPLAGLDPDHYLHGFRLDPAPGLYKAIVEFEPEAQYKWSEVDSRGGIRCNVLLGRSKAFNVAQDVGDESFDSRRDLVLTRGLDVARMAADRALRYSDDQERFLFELQMSYLLVSSVFERFMTLRFGPRLKPEAKIERLAADPLWARGIKNVRAVKEGMTVYRSDSGYLQSLVFRQDDPGACARFFYQFRSNIVHRGKAAVRDAQRVDAALKGFLQCLESVWNELGIPWTKDLSHRQTQFDRHNPF